MKNYSIPAVLAAVLALSSCSERATIKGSLANGPDKDVIVKQLNINSYNVLDTLKTAKDGSFLYKVPVKEGQPEFIYLFYGETRIAALLLEKGETVHVEADTLGNFEVSGSEGSEKLAVVDRKYTDFINSVLECETAKEISHLYVNHYRESVRYVLGNQKSLTCIPVLFEQLTNEIPIFNNPTDALIFRGVADSLKAIYPESAYVKALDKEASRREQRLNIDSKFNEAATLGYPDLNLPDMKGQKRALSSIDAKAILVHFWDSSQPSHSMLNNEGLLPVYKEFHDKGFEIYSVCLDADKAQWGNVVKSQNLPWINVNDGLGARSSSIMLYNLTNLPASFLIVDDELRNVSISGAEGLRKELGRLLRQ